MRQETGSRYCFLEAVAIKIEINRSSLVEIQYFSFFSLDANLNIIYIIIAPSLHKINK